MKTIQFYTHPESRGCTVRWLLEELGEPYDTHILGYDTTMKAPEYLKINPMGKVPAIVHKGKVITETAAICTYLADAFFEAGLAPALDARADYYRWIFFVSGPIEAALMDFTRRIALAPEHQRMLGFKPFEETLQMLTQFLDGRTYIAGDKFSAADCFIGSFAAYILYHMKLDSPVLEHYWNGLASRPALLKAQNLDAAAMQALK